MGATWILPGPRGGCISLQVAVEDFFEACVAKHNSGHGYVLACWPFDRNLMLNRAELGRCWQFKTRSGVNTHVDRYAGSLGLEHSRVACLFSASPQRFLPSRGRTATTCNRQKSNPNPIPRAYTAQSQRVQGQRTKTVETRPPPNTENAVQMKLPTKPSFRRSKQTANFPILGSPP